MSSNPLLAIKPQQKNLNWTSMQLQKTIENKQASLDHHTNMMSQDRTSDPHLAIKPQWTILSYIAATRKTNRNRTSLIFPSNHNKQADIDCFYNLINKERVNKPHLAIES